MADTWDNVNQLQNALNNLNNTVQTIHSMNQNDEQFTSAMQFNQHWAQQNYNAMIDAYQYQQELNQLQMQREDTAMQRQVADLKAAGLSPLMVNNGANSSPLNVGGAPLYDVSGANNARSDYLNRKMQMRQNYYQNKLNIAELTNRLQELKINRKRANIENKLLEQEYDYNEIHGVRDKSIASELMTLIEKLTGLNPSTVTPETVKDKVSDVIEEVSNELDNQSVSGDWKTYGLVVNPESKYGHMLDSDNYDNERNTGKLISEELSEKFYKSKLKRNDTEDIRKKLYNTDDYLKKHISLKNWLSADKDFINYYLKHGQFVNHQRYFD